MSSFIDKCVKEFMNEKFTLYMFKRGVRGSNNYVSNVMIRAMLSGRKIIVLKKRVSGLTFMVEKDKEDNEGSGSIHQYGSVKEGLNKEDLENTLNLILDGQKSRMKYFGFYENMSAQNKIEYDEIIKEHIALSGLSKTQR